MKKIIGIALLSVACLARFFAESPEARWRETFEKSFSFTLESRPAQISPAIAARYRLLADHRFVAAGDPSAAGAAAARLLFRYERDIRSGVDLQEAGARLVQAVIMMGRTGDPEKVLRKIGMVRRGGGTGNIAGSAYGSGYVGKPAGDSGDSTRGREKGK